MKISSTCIAVTIAAAFSFNAQAQCPITVTLFDNDFELNDGGMTPGGGADWEWGVVATTLLDSTCTGGFVNPPGASSGSNAWGNNLTDCHANLGDTSSLSITVDLSDPTYIGAELSWAQWHDVFVAFDYIFITANGTTVYFNDTSQTSTAWETLTLDLTSFIGQSAVEVSFKLFATAVVNRAGWYVDDVLITACSDPNVSVNEQQFALDMQVWPNPATDQLQVKLSDHQQIPSLSIRTVLGATAKEFQWNQGQRSGVLDLDGLAPGVYTLVAESSTGRSVKQIVIE